MYRVDALFEQYWGVALLGWIGRHDDPGHEISLVDRA
jgi:hypothetical protein